MRRGFGRAGPIGARFGGNSLKAAVKRNLPYLIKAKDILTAHIRGISVIDNDALNVCTIAVTRPSQLLDGQNCIIWAVWQDLAESGKLRGIRTGQNNEVDDFLREQERRPELIRPELVTRVITPADDHMTALDEYPPDANYD